MKSSILIIVAIISLLFVGCSSPRPAQQEFILYVKPNISKIDGSKYKNKTLKVLNVYASNSAYSHHMYYVEDRYKQFYYSQSKWAMSPKIMINKELLSTLSSTNAFAYVVSLKSKVESDFVLETTLNDFTQYFQNNNSSSYVVVSMTLSLIDSKHHSIVASKVFTKRVEVKSLNAAGGVKALDEAFEDILKQISKWIVKISQ